MYSGSLGSDPGAFVSQREVLVADAGRTNVEAVSEMLKPYDSGMMRCYPVSTRVNHVANDDAECSAHVKPAEIQDRLFQVVEIEGQYWGLRV
jgi:hypothetical protein